MGELESYVSSTPVVSLSVDTFTATSLDTIAASGFDEFMGEIGSFPIAPATPVVSSLAYGSFVPAVEQDVPLDLSLARLSGMPETEPVTPDALFFDLDATSNDFDIQFVNLLVNGNCTRDFLVNFIRQRLVYMNTRSGGLLGDSLIEQLPPLILDQCVRHNFGDLYTMLMD